MFGPSGEVLQPSEVLRKRPILVERGSFRPVTKVNIDMMAMRPAAVRRGAGKQRRTGGRADGDHHAQPARVGRDRSQRLPRPGGRAGRSRQDRPDLRLLRILPAGRLPGPLYDRADRDDARSGAACWSCSKSNTTRGSREAFWRRSEGFSRRTCGSTSIRCGACQRGGSSRSTMSRSPADLKSLYRAPGRAGRDRTATGTSIEGVLHIFSRDVLKRIKAGESAGKTWCPRKSPR